MELKTLFIFLLIKLVGNTIKAEVTLNDDPSLFPGHMEPLGSKQPRTEIEILKDYPTPSDFFENYIKPGRPLLIKGEAKKQAAYKLWTDDYMKSFPEAETEKVQCEPNLKEIRETRGFEVPLKEFIERYHNEKIYMVNKVPTFLQKDVLMPTPLRCNNTGKLMVDHVTWMSTGGTKSVLHSDDVDNINCLFHGSKELVFINPNKYKSKVPIDKPQGGYSSLDVDKVNFTKFPGLREVEYIHCAMEEGDCLFIPWRWYHQVNSLGNKDQQNIAVNIWFKHDPDHKPEQCDVPDEEATLDKFKFVGMDAYGEEGEDASSLLNLFVLTLKKTKHRRLNMKTFLAVLHKLPGMFVEQSISHLTLTEDFIRLAKEMFGILNVMDGSFVDKSDFDEIENSGDSDKIESLLNERVNEMTTIVTAQLYEEENKKPDEPTNVDENLRDEL